MRSVTYVDEATENYHAAALGFMELCEKFQSGTQLHRDLVVYRQTDI